MNFFEQFFRKPDFLQRDFYEFPLVNFEVISPSKRSISNFVLYSSSQLKRGHNNNIISYTTQLHSQEGGRHQRRMYHLDDEGQAYAFDVLLKKPEGVFLDTSAGSSALNSSLNFPFLGFTRPAFTLEGLYKAYGLNKTFLFKQRNSLEEKILFLEEFLDAGKVHSLKAFDFIKTPQLYLELLEQEYMLNVLYYAKKP